MRIGTEENGQEVSMIYKTDQMNNLFEEEPMLRDESMHKSFILSPKNKSMEDIDHIQEKEGR